MTTIKQIDSSAFYRRMCIVMIWLIVFYSSIIQNKIIAIPHGMLLLGCGLLILFYLANSNRPFKYRESMTEENIYMLWFMAYILVAGLLFSPDRSSHISHWITCLEYLFIQIVIATIIQLHLGVRILFCIFASTITKNTIPTQTIERL